MNAGVREAELPDDRRKHEARERRCRPDDEIAGDSANDLADDPLCFDHRRDRPLRVWQEGASGIREARAAAVPYQQRPADLLLETPQPRGERRLREKEPIGGRPDVLLTTALEH